VVDRVALVDQTSAALDRYGIDHGVIQAGHWRRRSYEYLQICSAQTLEARGFFPDLTLLIVDEAHSVRKEIARFIQARSDLRVLGLTATPFTRGLANLYSNVVNVSTTNQLIAEGFLVPLKVYAAIAPDMKGAKIVAGEWSDADIEQRGRTIIGDIVSEWVAKTALHFGGPVKTICFSATVNHGMELCRSFNEAGYRFVQVSYRDGSDDDRRAVIEEFRKPDSEIMGLVSCEVFTKGFDVPDVMCGIAARPYRRSLSSHIQQLGRVMRPAPEKQFALWLDHCGNVMRFRDDTERVFELGIDSLNDADLDSRTRQEPEKDLAERIKCSECGFILSPAIDICPACGHERQRRSMVETSPGQMVLVSGKEVEANGKYAFLRDRSAVWAQLAHISITRKKGDVEAAQRFAQAQYRNIYGSFARAKIENTFPEPPTEQLAGLVQSNIIRWAKGRVAL
jgi:superfamily II DNA or RNA helicase